jgi:cellulose synthase/poly-beta-1,6-N-acetylglucosamine synthase-like glycosyltransferase
MRESLARTGSVRKRAAGPASIAAQRYLAAVISVLLPARNAATTVAAALEGVLRQRGAPPFEVVCVEDASTDATPQVLAQFARSDARARIVRGEGRGLVAALQLGLAHCRGELIARMDADDVVHPDRLRLQAEALARDPSLGAVGSLVRCFPRPLTPGLARLEAWLDSVVTPEQCHAARFIEAPLVHPSTTFQREALEAVGGWRDAGWAEDWDLLLRLAAAGWRMAKVPEVLLFWRDSPDRLTRSGEAYRAARMIELRADHLAQGPLRERPFEVWGAGPTGKRLARALEARGLRPRCFWDVDPRKRVARGVRVALPAELRGPDGALILCAVGRAGAREDIRAELLTRGFEEGRDFLFAA